MRSNTSVDFSAESKCDRWRLSIGVVEIGWLPNLHESCLADLNGGFGCLGFFRPDHRGGKAHGSQ